MQHVTQRAPTVELNASVTLGDEKHEMFAYYVGGCCGLRSFYGFNGKPPEAVIRGIVMSGASGCLMVLTDAYSKGVDADAFKKFVEKNELGAVTVAPGVNNLYTGREIVGVMFAYDPKVLAAWVAKQDGKDAWTRPDNWYNTYDAIHMDGEYYQYGGRAKPARGVRKTGIHKVEDERDAALGA